MEHPGWWLKFDSVLTVSPKIGVQCGTKEHNDCIGDWIKGKSSDWYKLHYNDPARNIDAQHTVYVQLNNPHEHDVYAKVYCDDIAKYTFDFGGSYESEDVDMDEED